MKFTMVVVVAILVLVAMVTDAQLVVPSDDQNNMMTANRNSATDRHLKQRAPNLCEVCGDCKSRCKKRRKKRGQCDTPQNITCNSTFVDQPVTLAGMLICNASSNGITMSGEDAVLNCAGYSILAVKPRDDANSVGITLEDGATAINCNVVGFGTGVAMNSGNNTLCDSSISMSVTNGIETSGTGCMTMEGVDEIGTASGLGLRGAHDGTLRVIDSDFIGNSNNGIQTSAGTSLCMTLDAVKVNDNGDVGADLDHDGTIEVKNSQIIGNEGSGMFVRANNIVLNLEDTLFINNGGNNLNVFEVNPVSELAVSMFGKILSIGSPGDGFDFDLQGTQNTGTLEIFGDVVVLGNGLNGLELLNFDLTVEDRASAISCENTNSDVTLQQFGDETINGTLICDKDFGITCTGSCDSVEGGSACT